MKTAVDEFNRASTHIYIEIVPYIEQQVAIRFKIYFEGSRTDYIGIVRIYERTEIEGVFFDWVYVSKPWVNLWPSRA